MLKALRSRLIRCFLAGVFAVLPLVITIMAVGWVTTLIHSYIGPKTMVGEFFNRLGVQVGHGEPGWVSYLLGWVVVLGSVFLLGVILEFGAKNFVNKMVDGIFRMIPGVGAIYRTSQQVVGLLDKNDDIDLKGMSPVYCSFGRDPATLILALLVSNKKYVVKGEEYHIVVIPTAPVPFGGGLFFIPAENVTPAEMSVDALMSIYVSMGATASEYLGDKVVAPPSVDGEESS